MPEKKEYIDNKGPLKLLCTGRADKQKGFQKAIMAVSQIDDLELELGIVGTGSYLNDLKIMVEKLNVGEALKTNNKKIEIPVCCDPSFSLDMARLENKLNLTKDKILENFFNKEFFCYMTGFIAGMPFLGDLDENMRVQRLETPRVKVPKGSVGITEQFADIYTFESPGGWNILGNTPLEVFDSSKEISPNLINPGDTVKFKQITLEEYKNYNE